MSRDKWILDSLTFNHQLVVHF